MPDFFRLAVDIAWALDDWHRRVGPHTALSPHTIRVDRSGAVQLMPATGPADPDFAAPEQTGRLERGADERSDLYSLGALYYRLLTGQPPFQAGTPAQWRRCHLTQAPAPLATVAPGVPPSLGEIIHLLPGCGPVLRPSGRG